MKTCLIYGFAMALAGAVLTIVLYLLGLHSDPAKLATAQLLGTVGGLGIGIVCITLGTKARRAEQPATEEFTYGKAFSTGFMITLFAAFLGIFSTFAYATVINPGFADIIVQAETAKMEARGMTAAQIEGAEKMIRTMMAPGVQASVAFVMGLVFGTAISLIAAAFLKRPAMIEESDGPPAIG